MKIKSGQWRPLIQDGKVYRTIMEYYEENEVPYSYERVQIYPNIQE